MDYIALTTPHPHPNNPLSPKNDSEQPGQLWEGSHIRVISEGGGRGWMNGPTDRQTDEQTENLPILQDFVPLLGPLPKKLP